MRLGVRLAERRGWMGFFCLGEWGDGMDQDVYALSAQYASAAVRNTASAVFDKINAAKARKRDQETIAELENIISDLLADKAELVGIAQTYEEALVAQRISATDVEYISTNIVPVLGDILSAAGQPQNNAAFDMVERLLSVETVTILQLVGFNFKKAIGEPLTELLASAIRSRIPGGSGQRSSAKPPQNPRR
jgi:hypothetical protein